MHTRPSSNENVQNIDSAILTGTVVIDFFGMTGEKCESFQNLSCFIA